ncbi:Uncharacterised protein [uncultured archaeon]|nr:Uncharacterised protein [uncultured archaeon]
MEGGEEASIERLEKNRLENMTDAIFAFAMTLLVLNIEVAQQGFSSGGLDPVVALLASIMPDFFHYFTAFLVLAAFWAVHHRYFEKFSKIDRISLVLGIGALAMIALVPFSADLADTYIDYPLSAIVFEVNVAVIGAFFYLQWIYAERRKGLLKEKIEPRASARIVRGILVLPAASILAIAIALMGFTWSVLIVFAALPVYALFAYK